MVFGVAYNDSKDNGFDKNHPWVHRVFDTLEDAKREAETLKLLGFKSVTVFQIETEDISWDFIHKNQVRLNLVDEND